MLSFVSSLTVALLCVGGSVAAPAGIERRAVSADVLARLNLYEQYAAAAYCPGNNNSPNTKVTCSTGNCPLVQSANTNTVSEFQNSLATDVTGYVATDSTNRVIIVAFRGSESVRNWLTDFNFPVTDASDICAGCTAAQGFYGSWQEARTGVLAAVKSAAAANPTYSIACVGHSLGGALANFAAAQLRNQGYNVALYTYGAPRIGGAKISDYISAQPGGNYRVTHLNDPVPRLPPVVLGFVHISPEYYISSKNNVAVTANDITVYNGNFNLGGNTGALITDIHAHGWYFNAISQCYPGNTVEV